MFVYLLTFLFLVLKKKMIDADPEVEAASKEKTNVRTVKAGATKPSQPQEVPLDFTDIPVHWQDRTQEKTVFVLAPEIHVCKHHGAGYVYHSRADCHTLNRANRETAISTLPICQFCQNHFKKVSSVSHPDTWFGPNQAKCHFPHKIDKKCK